MKKSKTTVFVLVALLLSIATITTNAQLNNYDLKVGVQANYVGVWNEFEADGLSYLIRPFIRYELGSMFDIGLGVGYGTLSMKDYGGNAVNASIIPADLRLLFSPIESDSWNPYLYAGAGMVYYSISDMPINPPPSTTIDNNTDFFVPAGVGAEFAIGDSWLIDASVGMNVAFTDIMNGYETPNAPSDHNKYDKWWTAGVGIAYSIGGCEIDPDEDGLTNCEEEKLGTNPEKADTDDDGLKDGEEIQKYNTDPLNPDSDGDELKDGEEVNSYQTSPTKADTDDDGLNDFAEVVTYKSDPLNADTDGDTLKDGAEVNTHKTDPTKADTDGDKLNDGEEINKHKTNPLEADTDKGSVDDYTEVNRGTDPLNPKDDVVKKATTIDKVVLNNIKFEFDSNNLTTPDKNALAKLLAQLNEFPSAKISLTGYADSVGPEAYNLKLSKRRAESVKEYLVSNGIDADRLISDGKGEANPVASNKTKKGRAENRRVEIEKYEE
ncbi:MAG: OmpA family protein [Melioribacteraceae bacterium]|nr:OmpA family protein [Melioribacteraceae bacterium]